MHHRPSSIPRSWCALRKRRTGTPSSAFRSRPVAARGKKAAGSGERGRDRFFAGENSRRPVLAALFFFVFQTFEPVETGHRKLAAKVQKLRARANFSPIQIVLPLHTTPAARVSVKMPRDAANRYRFRRTRQEFLFFVRYPGHLYNRRKYGHKHAVRVRTSCC